MLGVWYFRMQKCQHCQFSVACHDPSENNNSLRASAQKKIAACAGAACSKIALLGLQEPKSRSKNHSEKRPSMSKLSILLQMSNLLQDETSPDCGGPGRNCHWTAEPQTHLVRASVQRFAVSLRETDRLELCFTRLKQCNFL
jgi:hypothetical protein